MSVRPLEICAPRNRKRFDHGALFAGVSVAALLLSNPQALAKPIGNWSRGAVSGGDCGGAVRIAGGGAGSTRRQQRIEAGDAGDPGHAGDATGRA